MIEHLKALLKSFLRHEKKTTVILYTFATETARSENRRPLQMHTGDAGFDVYADNLKFNKDYDVWEYGIGLRFSIPKGYYLEFKPRSSTFKTGLILSNCTGTIDRGYHGQVMAHFYEHSRTQRLHPYKIGERIGQLVVHPYTENIVFKYVDELPFDEDDRKGGFGSTGMK